MGSGGDARSPSPVWGASSDDEAAGADSAALRRETACRDTAHHSLGYREGLAAGKASGYAAGFAAGLADALPAGFALGQARGAADALHALATSQPGGARVSETEAGALADSLRWPPAATGDAWRRFAACVHPEEEPATGSSASAAVGGERDGDAACAALSAAARRLRGHGVAFLPWTGGAHAGGEAAASAAGAEAGLATLSLKPGFDEEDLGW